MVQQNCENKLDEYRCIWDNDGNIWEGLLGIGIAAGVMGGILYFNVYGDEEVDERVQAANANTCVLKSVQPLNINNDGTPDVLKYCVNGVTLEYVLKK